MLDVDKTKLMIRKLIKKMFEKQDELNIHTNGSDWKNNKDLKWYRAIWTECAELIDYTNWKWWRKQDISLPDIEMEVIDIWHFMMSDMMTHADIEICSETVFMAFSNKFETPEVFNIDNVRKTSESLAFWVLRGQKFHLEAFIKVCSSLGMNIEQIYKLYMGKNILNKFRQDNGYKQKTYNKIWNGKEDNIYLMEFLDKTDVKEENFEEAIYYKLSTEYNKILKKEHNNRV